MIKKQVAGKLSTKEENAPDLKTNLKKEALKQSKDCSIDSLEVLSHVLKICDDQIKRFTKLIENAQKIPDGLIVSGTSEKKEEVQGVQRGSDSDYYDNQTVTTTTASYELILRYNNEIEKAKREKLRCLELFMKMSPQYQDLSDDGLINALVLTANSTWADLEESENSKD